MKVITLMTGLLLTFAGTSTLAQKVQYKKGKVYVDKELKFDFVEVDGKENNSKLNSYLLKDLDGKTVFAMTDTAFYYEQLPHEISKRKAYEAYNCSAPAQGLQGVIPYFPVMGYPKQRIQDLQKAGYFKTLSFDETIFQAFLDRQSPGYLAEQIEEIDAINESRMSNYTLTEAAFGPLFEREPQEPGVVINIEMPGSYLLKEGNILVGKFNLKTKGSNNHVFEVTNRAGDVIGEVNIFQTPVTQSGLQQFRYNLKPFIFGTDNAEENYRWFYERVKSTGSPESTNHRLEQVARYLVNEGLI